MDDLFGFGDVIENFKRKLKSGEPTECPCCGRAAQMYRRKIHTSVAMQLIELYKMGGSHTYINSTVFIKSGSIPASDWRTAKHWDLIQRAEGQGGIKGSGMWKLTQHGIDFVTGQASIPRFAVVFDDQVQSFEGPPITIAEALGDKFNYSELMGGN